MKRRRIAGTETSHRSEIARNGPEQVRVAPRGCLGTMDAQRVLCVLTGHSGAFKVLRDARGHRSCALSQAIHEATAHAAASPFPCPCASVPARACAFAAFARLECARAHRTGCVCSVRLTIAARLFMCSPPITEPMSCAGSVSATAPGRPHVVGMPLAVRRNGVRSHAARCAPCTLSLSGCMLCAVCIVRWASRWTAPRSALFPLGRFPFVPFPLRQAAHPPLHSAAFACKRPSCPARTQATRRKHTSPFLFAFAWAHAATAEPAGIRCGALSAPVGMGTPIGKQHLFGRARTSRTQTTRRDHL